MSTVSLPSLTPSLTGADLGASMGVGYLGVALSSCVYGITCSQTYNYYRSRKSKSDHWSMRTLVAVLWILDTCQQGFTIAILYHYLIVNYARPEALLSTYWCIPMVVLFDDIIGFMVQNFLIFRIWKLSGNVWLAAVCELLSLGQFGIAMVYPIEGWLFVRLATAENALEPFGIAGLAASAGTDIFITAVTIYYLAINRTGFKHSDSMIGRLIVLTISTGAVTSCFTVAELIGYAAASLAWYDLFFAFMQSKLYTNAVLTTLNSRDFIRNGLEDRRTIGQINLNSIPLEAFQDRCDRSQTPVIDVHVSQTTETDRTESKSSFGGLQTV